MNTGVIFISGAGLEGWIWDGVTKNIAMPYAIADYSGLSRKDSKATLEDYVVAVQQQADSLNVDKIIVVAHSVGGVVGAELAKRLGGKLAGFVAVSALIPKPGGSFVSTLPFPQKILMPVIMKLAGTKPPESAIRSGLAQGLDAVLQDRIVSGFQQESLHLYSDKTSTASLPSMSSVYVRTNNDKEFSPALQKTCAENLGTTKTIEVASGHLPMITNPDVITECIKSM